MSGSGNGHPRERLSEYLDDVLSIEERSAIDRHLASCAQCRGSLEALQRLSRAVADEIVPPPPADLGDKIGRRLDEATVLRPRRWRFALPATVAATLAAIGILVAVQWREGKLVRPVVRQDRPNLEAEDKKSDDTAVREALPEAVPAAQAPPPPAASPEGSVAPLRDESVAVRSKQSEKLEAPAQLHEEPKDTKAVVAGVAAEGVAGEQGTGGAHDNRERALPAAPTHAEFDQATTSADSLAKVKTATPCTDRWSDSGVRGTWKTPDPEATVRELNTIGHDVGGIGLWRGIDDGRPYLLIVPRSRYLDVFYVLRSRGVVELSDPPALPVGDDCTAFSVTIVDVR